MVERHLITGTGGQTDAGQLNAGETGLFEVVPGYFSADQPLSIESEGGGGFGEGRTQIILDPIDPDKHWKFSYTIGHQNGLYSLRLGQGTKEWRIILLSGPDKPLGEPGPDMTFPEESRTTPTTPEPQEQ